MDPPESHDGSVYWIYLGQKFSGFGDRDSDFHFFSFMFFVCKLTSINFSGEFVKTDISVRARDCISLYTVSLSQNISFTYLFEYEFAF